MTGPILGWDVGGANLKVARVGAGGPSELTVLERSFPLWREPSRLPAALSEAADGLGGARAMAVTMTAELADCFMTKRQGVSFVLDAFRTAFPDVPLWVYGVDGQFRSADAARQRPHDVAAANWRASATLAARTSPDAFLVDVGSTTTDLIPVVAGRVATSGLTDLERLQTGELVYTGVLRTPVCAIVRWVPLGGRRCRVAAEHFAVTADVHLWLGRIEERDYTCETPDGRGRNRREAGARLARMVCADFEVVRPDDITVLAAHVAGAQVRQIVAGIRQVTRRLGPSSPRVVVLAGQGTFLALAAAEKLGLATYDLAQDIGPAGARAAPASAVACLLWTARDNGRDLDAREGREQPPHSGEAQGPPGGP